MAARKVTKDSVIVYADRGGHPAEDRTFEFCETLPIPFQVLDAEGVIRNVNQSWTSLLGYSREEAVGRPFPDFLSEDSAGRFSLRLQMLREGTGGAEEYEAVKKGGTTVNVSFICSAVADGKGGFMRADCILYELTAYKKAVGEWERKFRESERKCHSVFNTAGDGMIYADSEGVIVDVNSRFTEIVGIPKDELVGKCGIELAKRMLSAEDIPNVLRWVMESIAGRTEYSFEVKYRDKVLEVLVPKSEVTENATAVVRDITERKSMETKLAGFGQELEEKVAERTRTLGEASRIINMSPAVVFLWRNSDGWPVEYVSDNVKDVLGYARDELMSGGFRFASIIHPDDLLRVAKEVESYSSDGSLDHFTQEYRLIGKDGRQIWVDDRTNIRRGQDGGITHFQGVMLDITQRKRMEEADGAGGQNHLTTTN